MPIPDMYREKKLLLEFLAHELSPQQMEDVEIMVEDLREAAYREGETDGSWSASYQL
jgi:hypothetical protein